MKMIYLFICLMYYVCILKVLSSFYNIQIKKKQAMLCFTLLSIIIILCFFFKDSTFIFFTPIILLAHTILVRLIFNKLKYASIIYSYALFYTINACISSYIIIISNYDNLIMSDLITNCITCFSCFFIFLSKHRYKILQLMNWIPRYLKRLILCVSFSEMFMLSLLLNESLYSFSQSWFKSVQIWVASLSLFLLIIMILSIFLTVRNTKLKQITDNYEQQIKTQAEHYQKIVNADKEMRRFRHDFKNISIATEKLLTMGNYDEALSLIKESNKILTSAENAVSNFKTGNNIADALLNDKQKAAENINANISFKGIIPSSNLSPTDICVILGNTLDNAIEACEKLPINEQKSIKIESLFSCNVMLIKITNPIIGKINIKNNQISTTKTDKTLHGFGLYSLNTIVKKYGGTMTLNSTNDTFTIDMSFNFAA